MISRRRVLLALAAAAATPLRALAQQRPPKIARIAYLDATSSVLWTQALRAGLRDLGYVEGKNITIEFRRAEGRYEELAAFAKELVQLKPDVIVAAATPAVQAAQRATRTIPIVMLLTGDPVRAGFISSLARPGGNITGLTNLNVDVSSKYLELLRAAVPKLARVAVLVNPANAVHKPVFLRNIQAAASGTGASTLPLEASTAGQIEAAFAAMTRDRADAVIVLPDGLFFAQSAHVAQLAAKSRLPTMFAYREFVEAGGLMSYGQNNVDQFRRAATYVDKILKGARPEELPVEQPTKIELVINLRTARTIGLALPQDLLLRADKVLE